ncbi:HEAT repeat domain-containing protein [Methanococcus voltae]|uniref:HEAT domain containing protein n=1 Tax=Methanococcus voltae (strain ATCC BAA-1334 / A3) TaxID=456320 RepID=D7DU61_METV3|nr:HEAT repeat domain-containing protein [Methanococcus voltae]MCS3900471.1 hypothetical protein [Methanococcus voltae]
MNENLTKVLNNLKKDSWYSKLNSINTLGGLIFQNHYDAKISLLSLIMELTSSKAVVQTRALWAINNILKQYPELSYLAFPYILKMADSKVVATKNIARDMLTKPGMKYTKDRYNTILSKELYSSDVIVRMNAVTKVWKIFPTDPNLLCTLIPSLFNDNIEYSRDDRFMQGLVSLLVLQSHNKEVIDQFSDYIGIINLYKNFIREFNRSEVLYLLNSNDSKDIVIGLTLINTNPEKVNSEIISKLLELSKNERCDIFLKYKAIMALSLIAQKCSPVREKIINILKRSLDEQPNNLYTFLTLTCLKYLGETIATEKYIKSQNELVRAIAAQTASYDNLGLLNLYDESSIINCMSIMHRLTKKDVPEEIQQKYIKQLYDPWSYINVKRKYMYMDLKDVEKTLNKNLHTWKSEDWVSKVITMVDLGCKLHNNPKEYSEESIQILKDSINDSFGIVRTEGIWVLRVALECLEDPFDILEEVNEYIQPEVLINDNNLLVRLNFLLLLKKFNEILSNYEGCEDRKEAIMAVFIDRALNDGASIVSKTSEYILKYEYGIEINKDEIDLDYIMKCIEKYPYSTTPLVIYYLKKGIKTKGVEKFKIEFLNKIFENNKHCFEIINIFHMLDILELTDEETLQYARKMVELSPTKFLETESKIIKKLLNDINWTTRKKGLDYISKLLMINEDYGNLFNDELVSIALFDDIVELRSIASELLNKTGHGSPKIDKRYAISYLFKSTSMIINGLKFENIRAVEGLYTLYLRCDKVKNMEDIMMIVAKYRRSNKWYERLYAYKIIQKLVSDSKIEEFHYEIISWCTEDMEDPVPIIANTCKSILRLEDHFEYYNNNDEEDSFKERIKRLEFYLMDSDWNVRVEALNSLREFISEGHYSYIEDVIGRLQDPHWRVKTTALGILSDLDYELVVISLPEIINLLHDQSETVVLKALITLKKLANKEPRILPKIMDSVEDIEAYSTWSIKEEITKLKIMNYNYLKRN